MFKVKIFAATGISKVLMDIQYKEIQQTINAWLAEKNDEVAEIIAVQPFVTRVGNYNESTDIGLILTYKTK